MMPRRKPVGVIRQPSNSGSRADDKLEFIRCVGGQEPQIHELWTFAEDGITRKVHPFARVNVSNFSGDYFHTYFMTEERRRVTIFGQTSMNVSVKWLGVPIPFMIPPGFLGLIISWSLNCAGETEIATKFGLQKLALELISMGRMTALMAGLMNSGYNFRVEIPLVV